MKPYCSLAIICTLLTPFTALARKVETWPYERSESNHAQNENRQCVANHAIVH